METHGTTREESITMAAIQSINQKMPDLELRDLFAMQALSGLMVQSGSDSEVYTWDYETLANISYKAADAMLKARSRK